MTRREAALFSSTPLLTNAWLHVTVRQDLRHCIVKLPYSLPHCYLLMLSYTSLYGKTYVIVTWVWDHHVVVAFWLILGSHHSRQYQHHQKADYSKTRCHWPALRGNRTFRKQSCWHGCRTKNDDDVAVLSGGHSPDVPPSVCPSVWNV